MRKFAVGYIHFMDNELKISIIEAKDWKEALLKHSSIRDDEEMRKYFEECKTPQEAKNKAFDIDAMIGVVVI